MTTISAATLGDQYTIDNQQTKHAHNKELGQDEFLELMTAQLKNQDPLSPQDGNEFVAQLAQFNSLDQLIGIRDSIERLTAMAEQPAPAPTTSNAIK